ncbi:MGMT family protein, partial [Methylobacterium sp. WL103]|uniref:methylated-DNA--[protein]-cysteine S-methyltransferase n=1 Tax=Methylobacterium sp. WL103 TaxID=2603891 RepID=UPI0011CADAAB
DMLAKRMSAARLFFGEHDRVPAVGIIRDMDDPRANALAVAIPCHRVVRADGALSGYRWGIDRKRALLAREGVEPVKA